MNIRVLGLLEVAGDGGPISLPGAKHRRLLAALAIGNGKPCSTDTLIEAIWGAMPPASAPKLLQVYVSQLRKMLPSPVTIETASGAYTLIVEADRFDAATFERLLAEGRAARADGNATLAASMLDRALALWRGPAYADVAYDDFARSEAERLDEHRLTALAERNEARLSLGQHAALLPDIRMLVAEKPLDERFHAQLMLALYRCGRQAEALDVYRAFYERMIAELAVEPSSALRLLEQQILRQDAALDVSIDSGSRVAPLPAPVAPIRGRDRELAELGALLGRAEVRMIVLTGPGGSGKTRLALEAARRAASSFANGVVFVELAPLPDAAVVVSAIARSLGLRETPDRTPVESLAAAIRSFELLLVLDSAEHVPEAWPAFVELLALAPRLKLVITSRRVLHVSGEHVFPVPALAEDAALTLFVERARALDPTFDLAGKESDVRDICRSLDGLPLAIELAAARTNTLSPPELRRRLVSRLTVLTSGPRDLPARQQTLRDTLAWSVDLLSSGARDDLARVSVFAHTWTLETAESVVGASIDGISELVDLNLVQRRGASGFGLLDTVREFAAELLESGDQADIVRRRHALHAIETAEAAEAELGGSSQAEWLDRLEALHDDVRLGEQWLLASGETELALRLAAAIGRFRYVRGYLVEGRASLERALASPGAAPPGTRAKAFRVASAMCVLQGDWLRARALSEEGLALYQAGGDSPGVARSLSNLGAILIGAGEPQAAIRVLDEAIEFARELGETRVLALSLNNRGDVALTERDWPAAERLFSESLALLEAAGDEANVARSLFNLAAATLESGRDGEAAALLRRSLDRSVRLEDREDIAWCFIAAAAIAHRRGDAGAAASLLGAADRLLDEMGASLKPYERGLYDRTAGAVRDALDRDMFDHLKVTGRSMSLADAIQLTAAPVGSTGPA